MWKNVSRLYQRCVWLLSVLLVFFIGNGVFAQDAGKEMIGISGKVSSSDSGVALAGVSVEVKGSGKGTVTDEAGLFTLRVPAGSVISFHFVGYKPMERIAGKDWSGDIRLTPAGKDLDEVVVVGYGTQKKTSTTAAVSTLKMADIKDAPSANISNSLNGRLAGVIAAQNSGEPGKDGAEIHIRGVATTGSNAPLVIVDGVPRDFSRLDPNTIESFTVLKDAAAVAPYGMAGANGVILVTTKKGKSGKAALSYNGYVGYQNPTTIVKMVNAYDYVRLRNIADANAGQTPIFTDEQLAGYKKSVEHAADADYDKYPNTNAMDAIRNKNTLIDANNVSISGGSDNTTYYIGLGTLYQQGLWSTTKDKRYNLVSNIETRPTQTTTIGLSINAFNEIIDRPSADPNQIFSTAQAWWPINAIRYSNGLEAYNNGKRILPYLTSGSRTSDQTKIMGQLSVQQELPFIKGLSLKGVFSYDPTTYFDKNWGEPWASSYSINTTTNPYTYTEVKVAGLPSLGEQNQRWKEYTFQGFINYHNTFGKHDITALAVMEARKTNWDYFAASRGNYQFNIPEIDLGSSDKETWGTGGSSSMTRQVGYVYRVTYAYAGKYLFEASGRYDGHYYFAPGSRYGFFPAFSAGWRLSEEPFIRDNLHWIDNLKVRGSYGESGNLAGAPFQYSSAMTLAGNVYDFNGSVLQGVSERAEPNPSITWERAKKTDVGVEGSLWGGLLSFTADYFYEKRNNMLVSPNSIVPVEYGIGLSQVNAGIMSNHGIDLSVSSFHSFSRDLKVSLTANFTYAKNKLIQTYENSVTLNDPHRRRTGRPLNSQFGLKALGLFQESDDKNKDGKITADDGFPVQTFGDVAPGDIRYADVNGDGKVDASDETYLGSPILPQIIYGFNPRVAYKGLDLSLLFQGAAQSMVQIQKELVWPFFVGANATQKTADDYWTPDNPGARYPRLFGQGGNSNNQQNSSWWYWSSSYLRLKSVELGYTLPASVINRIKLRSVRIYVSGLNLFTISPVKDFFDPEMGQAGGGDNNARGWYYPQQKVVTAGLNVNF